MSENIGNLYVRAGSEEEVNSVNASPKKSTSLSSLRSLRDTFKRSESRTSQLSEVSATKSETIDNGTEPVSPVIKAGKSTRLIFSIQFKSILMGGLLCPNCHNWILWIECGKISESDHSYAVTKQINKADKPIMVVIMELTQSKYWTIQFSRM